MKQTETVMNVKIERNGKQYVISNNNLNSFSLFRIIDDQFCFIKKFTTQKKAINYI